MKTLPIRLRLFVFLFLSLALPAFGAIPQIISYQGKVSASGNPVNGAGLFKFALVSGDGATTFWSNDGASAAGSEPAAAVSLNVANGIYSVLLGDVTLANMSVLPATVFDNSDVRLRIWFSDGVHGFAQLSPDQRIAAVGYAIMAGNVQDGAITAAKIVSGAVGSSQIADGAVSSAKIANGAVGTAQMATGAVGAAQLADSAVTAAKISAGTITPDKLAKPLRTGSVASSSLSLDYLGGAFTVPFSPAFATVPNVTLTLDAPPGSPATGARLSITGRSTNQFSGLVSAEDFPIITSVAMTLDGTTTSSSGNVGDYACIKPINDFPAMAYYDVTNGDLMYVRATNIQGTAWGTPVRLDSNGIVGTDISMETVYGTPAVCYRDEAAGDLKFIRATDLNGNTWGAPVVIDSTGDVGKYASLAVVAGNPAISYYDATNHRLKYVRATDLGGSAWGTPIVVDGSSSDIGAYCSLLVVGGNPAISYLDSANTLLKYVRAANSTGSSWGTPVQAADDVEVNQTSLAFVNGAPAIAYQARVFISKPANYTQGLRYVRALDSVGNTWGNYVSAAAQGKDSGGHVCLIVANDKPAISYFDGSQVRFVRAAESGGATWNPAIVLDGATTGLYTSLTMVDGNPAVGYLATSSSGAHCLRYTRSTDSEGTAWTAPVTADGLGLVGLQPSLRTVNGYPAMSYYDESNGALVFIRATNAAGSAWGPPVIIETVGDVGQHTSLAIVNGNPAVSYLDLSQKVLKFVRALDSNGTAWGASVTLDNSSAVGQYTTLAVVAGNPAIAYYDYSNWKLRYIRATDANGSAWGSPQILDIGISGSVLRGTGQGASMAIINGNPAISYYDRNGPVRYIRALDATGTVWGLPVSVEYAGTTIDIRTSLALVDGRPAITFNNNNDQLKYCRADDAAGSSWSASTVLDSGVKSTHCLTVINGVPTISYRSGSLKAIEAADADGTVWEKPVVLDNTGDVGYWTSASTIDGHLGVAYYDAGNRDLKFVRPGNPVPFTILWMAQEP